MSICDNAPGIDGPWRLQPGFDASYKQRRNTTISRLKKIFGVLKPSELNPYRRYTSREDHTIYETPRWKWQQRVRAFNVLLWNGLLSCRSDQDAASQSTFTSDNYLLMYFDAHGACKVIKGVCDAIGVFHEIRRSISTRVGMVLYGS